MRSLPRALDRSLRWVDSFSDRRSLRPEAVYAVGAFSVVVTGLHFASMGLFLYSKIWWWDVMVHALSGLGVASIVYVYRPRRLSTPLALLVVIPVVVLAIGTWFEVYERLFTDFWVRWSTAYYLEDTAVDLVADTVGAALFGVLMVARSRYRRFQSRLSRR